MHKLTALLILAFALGAVHAAGKGVITTAGKLKIDVSGSNFNLAAEGNVLLSLPCRLSKADAPEIKELTANLGGADTPVSIDVPGIKNYCELRGIQHRCLEGDGCTPDEMKRVEKADNEGLDWTEPAEDFKKFIRKAPQAP